MSELLHFAEHRLQEGALIFMALVYILRIRWLLKFPAGKERQASTGSRDTSKRKGILYSWAIIGMPWAMESSRTRLFIYLQFVIFHIGVVAAITLSFIIPYFPGLLENNPMVVRVGQIIIWSACAVGFFRILRRTFSRYMRAISTPDDYFSLFMLTGWMLLGVFAQAHIAGVVEFADENFLVAFLFATSFFLIYVPFSKISHYLYYPFTRYWLGKALGHRGSYPYGAPQQQ